MSSDVDQEWIRRGLRVGFILSQSGRIFRPAPLERRIERLPGASRKAAERQALRVVVGGPEDRGDRSLSQTM